MKKHKIYYNDKIVKYFIFSTLFWIFFSAITGIFIASLLIFPKIPEYIFGKYHKFSYGILGFGRWRMIHTTTAIFGFVANIVFAGSYYSIQRLLKTRIYSDILSFIHFYTWQIFILLSWVTFILGINTSKEYSEHEWMLDILLTIVWLIYGINITNTLFLKKVKHLYVSIWFYIATWVAVSILHIFNNLEYPISLLSLKSYSIYSGVQDALVQWWYGHNAVAFILTTPILGLMYYFLPIAVGKPIFSYKLSIIHFWSLIFVYIWAGPHHLIYTTLPVWIQILGTIFSIMLIAPSWGGMLNGLLTLKSNWNKINKDPILKFFLFSIICYGFATIEGPLLATQTVNSFAHFTDWIIAHVHIGTLGWNGCISFAIIYWLLKDLWNTKLYSKKLANIHFFLSLFGTIIYAIPLYFSSITQSLMWKNINLDGTLKYKNFLDSVIEIIPYYKIRLLGGIIYFLGILLLIYNMIMTIKIGKFKEKNDEIIIVKDKLELRNKYYSWIESRPLQFTILSFIVIIIGGIVEIVPMILSNRNKLYNNNIIPYTPLELLGRDIYIREGCNSCHSQIIRPLKDEVLRYGNYSKSEEFVYDYPFLWGSKRTGPDLAREGKKKTNLWHLKHLYDPRITSHNSIMPSYSWIIYNKLNTSKLLLKMKTMYNLGVPYSKYELDNSLKNLKLQRDIIYNNIINESLNIKSLLIYEKKYLKNKFISLRNREIIALIAYLQRLGIYNFNKK